MNYWEESALFVCWSCTVDVSLLQIAIRYCFAWHLVNFFITLTSSLCLNFAMLIYFIILKIYFKCTTILITVVIRVVLKVFQACRAQNVGICIQTNTKLHLACYYHLVKNLSVNRNCQVVERFVSVDDFCLYCFDAINHIFRSIFYICGL